MKTLAILPLLFFFASLLTSCSLYSSQGRKQFESESPGKIRTYSLVSCQDQNAMTAWFQSEFPAKNYELVVTESDLEIWKSTNANGSVEIRAVQVSASGQTTCKYQFSDEGTWRAYQKQFIQELENNMMIAE